MTDVDPAWKASISKKIAELTKIVFRLHSDSMDHRDSLLNLKESYEDEITLILNHSKEMLAAAQQEATSFHDAIQTVVKQEFEAKFERTRQEFDAAKSKLESQFTEAITRAESEIRTLKSQLAALRHHADSALSEFEGATKEVHEIQKKVLLRLDSNRKREFASLLEKANAKYEQTLLQTQQKEEEVRARYDKEVSELRKSLSDSRFSAEAALSKRKEQFEATIQKLLADQTDIQKALELLASFTL
jgi:serologically defined colon cancer antigen 8